MILDPIDFSLVYLFVFSVIRSNPDLATILIGISLFRILQSGFKSGVASVKDFSGGIKGERVRTRVLTNSMIRYRLIDSSLQSIGVASILLLINTEVLGIISFLICSQVLGLISEGLGLNLAIYARRIPDLSNFVNYFLLLMFFGSPALYPMEVTSGIHYRLNELNPFTYFAEFVRQSSGLESVFHELNYVHMLVILSVILLLSFRGYNSLERQRWEVSSWS